MLREIFERQYKGAAAEGAIIELRLRLLADKVPQLQKYTDDRYLKNVETQIVRHFASCITEEEKITLELCRELRNKILHCDFPEARKRLERIGGAGEGGNVKKIDILGLSGAQIADKITDVAANVDGTCERVAEANTGPGHRIWLAIGTGQRRRFHPSGCGLCASR